MLRWFIRYLCNAVLGLGCLKLGGMPFWKAAARVAHRRRLKPAIGFYSLLFINK
jgi:hypothetical protein